MTISIIDDGVELLPQTLEKLLDAFSTAPDAIGMQCIDRVLHRDGRATRVIENVFGQGFFSKRSTGEEAPDTAAGWPATP